jgi:hypothetical protein
VVIGTGAALALVLLVLLNGSGSYFQPNPVTASIAALVVSAIFGGPPGLIGGLVVGAVRRSRATALAAQQPSLRQPSFQPPAASQPPYRPPVVHDDVWAALVASCEQSARRVAEAVAAVPPSPAKDWMVQITGRLQPELERVRGMAQLGRALGGADENNPVRQRLVAARRDFAAFEAEVGRIALTVFDGPDLARARTDLEYLEQQLPHLTT